MKNPMGKQRNRDNPYLIFRDERTGWEWRVLKSWQLDNSKPYARWFCVVTSPMTSELGDMGDVYVTDVGGVLVDWDRATFSSLREVIDLLKNAGKG